MAAKFLYPNREANGILFRDSVAAGLFESAVHGDYDMGDEQLETIALKCYKQADILERARSVGRPSRQPQQVMDADDNERPF